MTDRHEIDRLLRELYAARVSGDLDAVCRKFTDHAKFCITGASRGNPIAITATGINEIRSWLALLIKTFQLRDHTIISIIIDGAKAAAQWRAQIHSRTTGVIVLTELVDLVEIHDGRIASYTEFFAPR